jgi:dephospho-CoA kinase
MTYVVGLTGGIGCGKSKASDIFSALGADVVDTDVIARELTAAHGRAMPLVRAEFGDEYIASDGSLDRDRMRRHVFGNPAERRRLEALLHPLIGAEARARIAHARGPYTLLVVPLLLETGAYADLLNRVLVVDCDEALQIRRTMARSGLTAAEVQAIMDAQTPRAERLRRADDVLSNDSDMESLRAAAVELHAKYLEAAASST